MKIFRFKKFRLFAYNTTHRKVISTTLSRNKRKKLFSDDSTFSARIITDAAPQIIISVETFTKSNLWPNCLSIYFEMKKQNETNNVIFNWDDFSSWMEFNWYKTYRASEKKSFSLTENVICLTQSAPFWGKSKNRSFCYKTVFLNYCAIVRFS